MQFQLSFTIPKISVLAKYRSSGVLIMVQASGGGDYWGEYGKCGRKLAKFLTKLDRKNFTTSIILRVNSK